MFGPLRSLVLGLNQAAHGVDATVTRPAPDNAPIATKVIWVLEPVGDGQPFGTDFRRGDPRRVLAIVKADVPTLPRGTVVLAPDVDGGTVHTWLVDGIDRALDDQWRAVMKLSN